MRTVATFNGRRDKKRLIASGHSKILALLERPEIASIVLEITGPSDASRLADALINASRVEDEADSIMEFALNEYHRWRPAISDWFSTHGDPRLRATLIAAAVVGCASAATISDAADALCNSLKDPVEPPGALSGPGLTERMRTVEAQQTRSGYTITAGGRRDFDIAVIDYVWDEYAQIRKEFADWLLALGEWDGVDVERIATVSTDIAIRRSNHGFLDHIKILATSGKPARFALAVTMINKTVLDQVVGGKVRTELLLWAQRREAPLLNLVAAACAGPLGHERTTMALTRLRYILGQDSSLSAVDAACKSLTTLASDERLRLGLLEAVVGWLRSKSPSIRRSGAVGFLALADASGDPSTAARFLQQVTAGEPQIADLLSEGFLALPGNASDDEIAVACHAWLDATDAGALPEGVVTHILTPVLVGQTLPGALTDVMVGGSGIRARILSTVFASLLPENMADDWRRFLVTQVVHTDRDFGDLRLTHEPTSGDRDTGSDR